MGNYGAQIRGASIKSVTIGGDLTGVGPASASLVAEQGDLGAVIITGTFTPAAAMLPSQISAEGRLASVVVGALAGGSSATGYLTAGTSLGKLTVADSVSYFKILAGYDIDLKPLNPSATIGHVLIAGNWQATDLVAGALTGTDGLFGTSDDAPI